MRESNQERGITKWHKPAKWLSHPWSCATLLYTRTYVNSGNRATTNIQSHVKHQSSLIRSNPPGVGRHGDVVSCGDSSDCRLLVLKIRSRGNSRRPSREWEVTGSSAVDHCREHARPKIRHEFTSGLDHWFTSAPTWTKSRWPWRGENLATWKTLRHYDNNRKLYLWSLLDIM